MKLRDLLYETFNALLANRVRSLLTILGIVIGIGAVIAMTSLIDGMKMQLVGQLGLNMSRMVQITCRPPGNQQLDMDDVDELSQELASDYEFITGYTYAYSSQMSSSTGSMENNLNIFACEPNFFVARGYEAEKGRLFTQEEADEGAMVVVINEVIARELFGSDDADCVGQQVRIGNDQYTVVGVISNDAVGYGNDYGIAHIPYETAVTRILGQNTYQTLDIIGFAREGLDMYAVADNTEAYLRTKYNIPEPNEDGSGSSVEDFLYVDTAQQYIDQLDSTMAIFRMLALAVASISLLVGGIGIMNMMLTNVTERIREIGLRKALGARRADITKQFLLESVTICLVGGAVGVAVGYGLAWILATVAGSALSSMTGGSGGTSTLVPIITGETVVLATGICVGIGILFGWGPARRAAKMDPVESLRYQ